MANVFSGIILAGALLGAEAEPATPPASDAEVAKVVEEAHKTTWSDATQVVVTAHVPGPAMWKLTRGPSTLWILGILEQTPQGLTWDSPRLRRILKESNALILPGRTTVSEEAFQQWDVASRYHAGDTVYKHISLGVQYRLDQRLKAEHLDGTTFGSRLAFARPARVGADLHAVVRDTHHILTYQIVKDVQALPEASQLLPIVPYDVSADSLSLGLLQLSRAGEDACLDDYLSDIDWDLNLLPAAARAWASGDIVTLQKDYRAPPGLVCNLLVPQWKQQYEAYNLAKMTQALSDTLQIPGKTVALVPLGDLLRQDGVLDRLQAQGAEITSPPSDDVGTPPQLPGTRKP